MSDYTPQDGDEVLATIRGAVERGMLAVSVGHGTTMRLCGLDNPIVVRVEPAPVELPTGFGAVLRATLHDVAFVKLVHLPDDVADVYPWRTKDAIPDCDCRTAERGYWHTSEALSDVEVLTEGITS